jgi:hypothetical protein
MVTKVSNANLDLVNPPISNIVTKSLTVQSLDSVLIGAPNGTLEQVFIGTGLALVVIDGKKTLIATGGGPPGPGPSPGPPPPPPGPGPSPGPPPPGPGPGYGEGLYGTGTYDGS